MKNRIEKNNLTKFDYTARTLGIVGGLILGLTFAFGGSILMSLHNENRALMQQIQKPQTVEEKLVKENESQNLEESYIIIDE